MLKLLLFTALLICLAFNVRESIEMCPECRIKYRAKRDILDPLTFRYQTHAHTWDSTDTLYCMCSWCVMFLTWVIWYEEKLKASPSHVYSVEADMIRSRRNHQQLQAKSRTAADTPRWLIARPVSASARPANSSSIRVQVTHLQAMTLSLCIIRSYSIVYI